MKFKIKYKHVLQDQSNESSLSNAQTQLINSEFLDGLNVSDARKKIIREFENNKSGIRKTLYRLKDWGFQDSVTGDAPSLLFIEKMVK